MYQIWPDIQQERSLPWPVFSHPSEGVINAIDGDSKSIEWFKQMAAYWSMNQLHNLLANSALVRSFPQSCRGAYHREHDPKTHCRVFG
jgi:hypothetical protein